MSFQLTLQPFVKEFGSNLADEKKGLIYQLSINADGDAIVTEFIGPMALYPYHSQVRSVTFVVHNSYLTDEEPEWVYEEGNARYCYAIEVNDFCGMGYQQLLLDDLSVVESLENAREAYRNEHLGPVVVTIYDPYDEDTANGNPITLYDVRVKDGQVSVTDGGEEIGRPSGAYWYQTHPQTPYSDGDFDELKVANWMESEEPNTIWVAPRAAAAISAAQRGEKVATEA